MAYVARCLHQQWSEMDTWSLDELYERRDAASRLIEQENREGRTEE